MITDSFILLVSDLQECILEFLDYGFILQCIALVNKQLYSITKKSTLWHRLGYKQSVLISCEEAMLPVIARHRITSMRILCTTEDHLSLLHTIMNTISPYIMRLDIYFSDSLQIADLMMDYQFPLLRTLVVTSDYSFLTTIMKCDMPQIRRLNLVISKPPLDSSQKPVHTRMKNLKILTVVPRWACIHGGLSSLFHMNERDIPFRNLKRLSLRYENARTVECIINQNVHITDLTLKKCSDLKLSNISAPNLIHLSLLHMRFHESNALQILTRKFKQLLHVFVSYFVFERLQNQVNWKTLSIYNEYDCEGDLELMDNLFNFPYLENLSIREIDRESSNTFCELSEYLVTNKNNTIRTMECSYHEDNSIDEDYYILPATLESIMIHIVSANSLDSILLLVLCCTFVKDVSIRLTNIEFDIIFDKYLPMEWEQSDDEYTTRFVSQLYNDINNLLDNEERIIADKYQREKLRILYHNLLQSCASFFLHVDKFPFIQKIYSQAYSLPF
jgi:hypothetical protein